ncbi:MAG: hypothetical protein KQI35_07570 [Bacteroidetes bacterium]|nr:hypothetical protein [Bacteroidota bacterium]
MNISIKQTLYLATIALIFASCMPDDATLYLKSADFNPQHRVLGVDYATKPDTTLHQIILKSGIRESGYGIILNVDNSLTENESRELVHALQLQDINAVHVFHINSETTPENNVIVAIEQARFNWVFSKNIFNLSGMDCKPMVSALKVSTESGGILVIEKENKSRFIECLEQH